MEVLRTGTLPCGADWELSESRHKAHGLTEGYHLILQFTNERKFLDVNANETAEIFIQAMMIADEMAEEPGKYRICVNGPLTCNCDHFHMHIILPKASDKLMPIVSRSTS